MNKYNLIVKCKDTNAVFLAYDNDEFIQVNNGNTYSHYIFEQRFNIVKASEKQNYQTLVDAYKNIQKSKGSKNQKINHIFIENPVTHFKMLVKIDDVRFQEQIVRAIRQKTGIR